MNKKNNTKNTFKWIGITSDGLKAGGDIESTAKTTAIKILDEKNITVLSIKKKYSINNKGYFFKRSTNSLIDFTESLLWLLQGNIKLANAIKIILNSTTDKQLKKILAKILTELTAGSTFSYAIGQHTTFFPNTYRQLITAGEKSDQLEKTLSQAHAHLSKQLTLKNKINKAMIYPTCVLIITFLITIGLLVFVIPQFQEIYKSFNAKLPAITLNLISLSQFITQHAVLTIAMITFTLIIFRYLIMKHTVFFNKALLMIPIYKQWVSITQTAQWSQTFAITLSAGISFTDALFIANQTITHLTYANEMANVYDQVTAGKHFCAALSTASLVPDRAQQFIQVAENTDALPQAMAKLSMLYQQQVDTTYDHLSKLIEPVIMIFVACGIGTIIIAMYLPIFKMGSIM